MSAYGQGMSRRRLLGVSGAAGAAFMVAGSGCGTLGQQTSGELLASAGELPEPFTVPLPLPREARPEKAPDGSLRFDVAEKAADVEILPGRRTTVWGFDGTFPGPTFRVPSGTTARVRVANELPVPTSTHLHGGVTPPDSDGYPTDLVVPKGMDTRHLGHHGGHMKVDRKHWTFHRRGKEYVYPLEQRAATLWYHDHRMDFSAPQVWKGLAGFFLVEDATESRLPLPAGEKELPLMICDRSFDADGQFRYPSLDGTLLGEPGVKSDYAEGVQGDVVLVNGAPWPTHEVEATRYRLRLLNASNARRLSLELDPGPEGRRSFVQIGSDNGLLARPKRHDALPLAPAERLDVVVDFSRFRVGTKVRLVNTLGEGGTRDVMEFHVVRKGTEHSSVPAKLADVERLKPEEAVRERRFDFRQSLKDGVHIWTVNGETFSPAGSLASPALGSVERWKFTSDFHHPVHVHLAHFQVLARNGREPRATDAGWKDTVDVRPYEVVEVLAKFDGYRGRYMMHCHNLEHEDMAMMANFRVV